MASQGQSLAAGSYVVSPPAGTIAPPRHLMADPELIQPPERRLHGSSAIEQDALEQVAYRPEQGYDQL